MSVEEDELEVAMAQQAVEVSEGQTYVNRYLMDDLQSLEWAVRRESHKYGRWEIPAYLAEALDYLNKTSITLNRYRESIGLQQVD